MSATMVHLTPTPDFILFSGIEVLAILFTMALWGISCLQMLVFLSIQVAIDSWRSVAWKFSVLLQKDSCYIRLLVTWLWSMDTVHQGLLISGVYKAIRDNATASTDHISLEYLIQILFTVLVTTPAQGFFAYRIWMFSNKSKLIISFLAPTILFQLIGGIIFMVMKNIMIAFQRQINCNSQRLPARQESEFQLSQDLISIQGIAIAYFIDGAVVDLFIAITMCIFLWRRYLSIGNATKEYDSRSPFPRYSHLITIPRTRSMIYRLTLFSINTGTWPAIIAIITLVMLMAYPTYYLYAGLYFFLSPVYCNTVLASINARPYIQNVNNGRHVFMPKDSGIQFGTNVSSGLHARGTHNELELGSYKVGPEELTLSTEGTASLSTV
ncbi:hypothetical protein ARMSODRAFT_1015087 [Armillaria solidipes]|uniref:DUF6534 domain-containing protein n=1 Tax=Armillaria solidipes TaxID=1076256 RepID=A0A2H3BVB4_9AGAR|nr:hypothetical protein ARMSODRAFT_1015087 [Armillaria solidipes]